MRIPDNLVGKYPDTAVPNNQCRHFRNLCQSCGGRYAGEELECKKCHAGRLRCNRSRAERNQDSCWVHSRSQAASSLYDVVTGRIGDIAFEDVLARDDRSVDQEFNLARWALMLKAGMAKDQLDPDSMMRAVQLFMDVAEKRKRLEDGVHISVKVDDDTAVEIRRQVTRVIKAFSVALDEVIPEEAARMRVLTRAREMMHNPAGLLQSAPVAEAVAKVVAAQVVEPPVMTFDLDGDLS